MKRRVLRLVAYAGVPIVSLATAAAPVAADAPTAETPSPSQVATLTPAELSLLTSGSPIDVTMDPNSGDVLSVAAASASIAPAIANHSICNPGDGCYQTNRSPYADQGFYGTSGTYYGSWPYRSGYSSGNYTVSGCWSSNCGVKIAPNSHVTFTSDVTGTSFTIY